MISIAHFSAFEQRKDAQSLSEFFELLEQKSALCRLPPLKVGSEIALKRRLFLIDNVFDVAYNKRNGMKMFRFEK